MYVSIGLQAILSIVAAAVTAGLLAGQPGKEYLAFATGCFHFVHPIPMTFGLAALVFWDRVKTQEEANTFSLWPALAGALIVGMGVIATRLFTLAAATLPAHTALTVPQLSWLENMRTCLATPLVEEYVCRLIVFVGLTKVGWSSRYALIASALSFAALQGQPAAFLVHALAGGVYGLLYVRYGFWCAVTAHSLSNAWTLLASLWL